MMRSPPGVFHRLSLVFVYSTLFGQIRPNFQQDRAEIGRRRPDIGRIWSNFGQGRNHVGESKPLLAEVGSKCAQLVRVWPNIGLSWSNFDGNRETLGRNRAICCTELAELDRNQPRADLNLATFGPNSTETAIDQVGAKFGRTRAEFGRCPTNIGQHLVKFGPNATEAAQA